MHKYAITYLIYRIYYCIILMYMCVLYKVNKGKVILMKRRIRTLISLLTAIALMLSCLTAAVAADAVTDELAPAVLEGALRHESDIDISDIVSRNGWNLNETTRFLGNAYLANPELFFVSNVISVNSIGKKFYVNFEYTMTAAERSAAKKKIDAVCEKIVSGITPEMTVVQKLMYVHDWLILNCKYDYGKTNYDMYDCLISQSAVCQGYSLAYMYILKNYLNVDCTIVISNDMGHAWNYVKLGNNWYHVDITKDDASTVYRNKSYDNLGFAMHENFLMSDELCRNTSVPHFGWEVVGGYPAANDKSYDKAFWRDVTTPVVMDANTGYYAVKNDKESSADICAYNFKTNVNKPFIRIRTKWYSRRNQSGSETYDFGRFFYKQIWMSICLRNGKLYFNTNKNVYSYDLSTKKTKRLYTLNKGDQQIFGCMFTSSDMLRLAYRYDITYPESYISLRLR